MKKTTIDRLEQAFKIKVGTQRASRHLILGIPELDYLIGDSVTPGSILEIHGGPGSGKTSVLARVLASGATAGNAAFVDCDHSMYNTPVRRTTDDWIYNRPKNLQEATDTIGSLSRHEYVELFLVDSVNSLSESGVVDGASHHGLLCKFMNELASVVAVGESYGVVTSQIRMGDRSASGKAVSRHAAVRVLLERAHTIKRVNDVGCLVRATLLPNRSGLRGSTELEILYPRR